MKRVIEIDKNVYESLAWMRKCDDLGTYYNAIADSKPLDDVLDNIMAEIDHDAYRDASGTKFIFINQINQIIDNYTEAGTRHDR